VCEVQSDKATVEITSRFDGVVDRLSCDVGDMAKVGSPLLFMRSEEDDIINMNASDIDSDGPSDSDSGKDKGLFIVNDVHETEMVTKSPASFTASLHRDINIGEEDTDAPIETLSRSGKVLATPAVRRLSMEYALDLSSIEGMGKGGRVLKSDVLKELHQRGMLDNATRPLEKDQIHGVDASSVRATRTAITSTSTSADTQSEEIANVDKVVPIRGFNRIMVKSMTSTLQVPHMVYSDEVDISALKECRQQLKPMAESKGVKLSYLPFAVKACSLAMKEYPLMNTSIDAENMTITYHNDHDIGVAIDTARGLVVPVLRKCQDLSVLDIAMELTRMRDLAEQELLSEEELTNPTFTLSNIGAIGGTVMSPIVLPPQVAIGAMGKIQRVPRFVGDTMEVKEAHLMSISWGGDHRVIDGGTLGRFSNVWKGYIESPMSMAFTMK